MTKRRALEILRDYWGTGETVPVSLCDEIIQAYVNKNLRRGRSEVSLLQATAEIAGIWTRISLIKPFDNAAVRSVASRWLAQLDIEEPKYGRQD